MAVDYFTLFRMWIIY